MILQRSKAFRIASFAATGTPQFCTRLNFFAGVASRTRSPSQSGAHREPGADNALWAKPPAVSRSWQLSHPGRDVRLTISDHVVHLHVLRSFTLKPPATEARQTYLEASRNFVFRKKGFHRRAAKTGGFWQRGYERLLEASDRGRYTTRRVHRKRSPTPTCYVSMARNIGNPQRIPSWFF